MIHSLPLLRRYFQLLVTARWALLLNVLCQLSEDNPLNKNESKLSDLKYDWWKLIDERLLMKNAQLRTVIHDLPLLQGYFQLLVTARSWLQLSTDLLTSFHLSIWSCFSNPYPLTIRFDFWSTYWHEPIKNKNKNGIFEVVFGFQKWTSIFEFWRLSKTGCHFFPCFWFFPIGTRNQRKKQKHHFCFCFWRPYWDDLKNYWFT